MGEQLYSKIWRSALPSVIDILNAGHIEAGNSLAQVDFKAAGNRKDYTFRLEIEDGMIMNNIEGSAVARDLAEVFLTLPEAVEVSSRHRVVLRLLANFELKVTLEAKKHFK